ncbi:MAG: hypothetical protein WC595_06320 [Candidatus Nanoarchaeia archaeon]
MKRTICEECGGKIEWKQTEYILYNHSFGLFPTMVCTKCGEEVFDQETSLEIEQAVKKAGLWGLERKQKLTA